MKSSAPTRHATRRRHDFRVLLLALPPILCFSFPLLPHARYAQQQRELLLPSFMVDPLTSTDAQAQVVEGSSRKRWRRRRKDSSVVPIVKDVAGSFGIEDTINNLSEDGMSNGFGEDSPSESAQGQSEQSTSEPQCPIFSMTFPRYRIDLTSSSKATESEQRRMRRVRRGIITKLVKTNSNDRSDSSDERRVVDKNGDNGLLGGIMGGIFKGVMNPTGKGANTLPKNGNSRARKGVESLYQEEVKQGSFRWISSSSLGEDSIVENSSILNADEDFVAAAGFWRMAADIVGSTKQNPDLQSWYLALPDTTKTVAQNLCDILNWYADLLLENLENEGCDVEGGRGMTTLRAEIDTRTEDDAIPVVRFTAIANNKDAQQQNEERREKLPTAEDTERRTKAWVKRLLVQLGICPFTKSEVKSGQGLRDLGVPVANIMYRHSSALSGGNDAYLLMADTWEAISDMVAAGSSGVSSILLSAPGYDDDFEFWAGPVFAMLETCVGAIQAEEMIGVVCFHPKYVTPDGKSWPGFGHMHSVPRLKKWYNQHSSPDSSAVTPLSDNEIAAGGAWQRRTPHAVINVLRAEQLEAAEGRRSTGELYERNIRVLVGKGGEGGVGLEKLEEDLKREQCL